MSLKDIFRLPEPKYKPFEKKIEVYIKDEFSNQVYSFEVKAKVLDFFDNKDEYTAQLKEKFDYVIERIRGSNNGRS